MTQRVHNRAVLAPLGHFPFLCSEPQALACAISRGKTNYKCRVTRYTKTGNALDGGDVVAGRRKRGRVARSAPALILLASMAWLHCSPAPPESSSSESTDQVEIPSPDPAGMEPRVADRINQAREAVLGDPTAEAWGHFGEVCHAHFLYAEAETCYRKAMALSPGDVRWAYLQALVREQVGSEPERVIDGLRAAADLNPRYPAVHYRLGVALGRAGRLEEAKAAYLKAIDLDADFAVAHRGVGQVLLSLGDVTGAIEHLERAADLVPADGAAQTALAQAYSRQGLSERSAQAIDKAEKLQPIEQVPDPIQDRMNSLAISATACTNRARSLMAQGDFASAIPDLKIVLEVAPTDAQAQLDIGTAYLNTSKPDLAIAHLGKAIDLKDDLIGAYVKLGWLLMSRNQLDESTKLFRRGLAKAPEDARLYGSLAMVLTRRGELDEAITTCSKAVALAPESADLQTICGAALFEKGDVEQAVRHYREALKLVPNHSEARRKLGQALEKLDRDAKTSVPAEPSGDP